MQLAPVMMNFRYGSAFGARVPEAYETLLLDAMLGDSDAVRAARLRRGVVGAHHARARGVGGATGRRPLPTYEAGEWGPTEADALMARDGRRWRTL